MEGIYVDELLETQERTAHAQAKKFLTLESCCEGVVGEQNDARFMNFVGLTHATSEDPTRPALGSEKRSAGARPQPCPLSTWAAVFSAG